MRMFSQIIPVRRSVLSGFAEAASAILDVAVQPQARAAAPVMSMAPSVTSDMVSRIPMSSSTFERVDSAAVVKKVPQPTAANPGRVFSSMIPSKAVKSLSTSIPMSLTAPVGSLGATPLYSFTAATTRPMTAMSVQDMFGGGGGSTPWTLYAAYGAAGLAVVALGYTLLMPKK